MENISANKCVMKVHAVAVRSEKSQDAGATRRRKSWGVEKAKRWPVLLRVKALGLDGLAAKMFVKGMYPNFLPSYSFDQLTI